LEEAIVDASSSDLLHASAPDEIVAAAIVLVLRERLLAYAEAVLDARDAIAELGAGHLLTLLLATSNGQVVQPTSLGHYLHAQTLPLARTGDRLREVFQRLNRSPLGAVSGMSTAMPIRPKRAADLLGFDTAADNTLDALAGGDVLSEMVGVVASVAIESSRFVADLQFWARDDVGLLVPGDEFIHHSGAQPQRRDPLVLDHLRGAFGRIAMAPAELTGLLLHRPMMSGGLGRIDAFRLVGRTVVEATQAYWLLGAVLRSVVVNRALFAHRANRGFSTSSELADLLAVDFKLPREQAQSIVERVVIDWTEQGGEATSLTPQAIDSVAMAQVGRELGVDPELLAKCLSPKRFIERRTTHGGPAPSAVGAAFDRESFAQRREHEWLDQRRAALADARGMLIARCAEIADDPAKATRRPALLDDEQ
jgi:argininosuccinate lyase